MSTYRDSRMAAWAGIMNFPLAVLSLFITGSFLHLYPNWGESPAQVAQWFVDNRARAIFQAYASNFSYLLLIIFVAGLVGFLRRHNASGIWSRTLLPTTAAVTASVTVANGLWCIAAHLDTSHYLASDTLGKLVFDASMAIWLSAQPLYGFFLLAAAAAIRRCDLLPRWLWLSAIAIAIPNFLFTFTMLIGEGWLAPLAPSNVAPYALFFSWCTAAGVALLRVNKGDQDNGLGETRGVDLEVSSGDGKGQTLVRGGS
jgi:hypothetical protein